MRGSYCICGHFYIIKKIVLGEDTIFVNRCRKSLVTAGLANKYNKKTHTSTKFIYIFILQ